MRSIFPLLSLFASPAIVFGQGAIDPVSGPAPTMKTLDQVEARIPLSNSSSRDLAADGSYYLTEDLLPGDSITITGADVELDLNGFRIFSNGNPAIVVEGKNASVKNGTIRNSNATGISIGSVAFGDSGLLILSDLNFRTSGNGVRGLNLEAWTVRIHDCAFIAEVVVGSVSSAIALYGSSQVVIENCSIKNYHTGILIGNTSISTTPTDYNIRVVDTQVADSGQNGIMFRLAEPFRSRGVVIKGCSFVGNGKNGFEDYSGASSVVIESTVASGNGENGFLVGIESSLIGCTANGNVNHGFASSDTVAVGDMNSFVNCVANRNGGSGFFLDDRNNLTNCTANFNGVGFTMDEHNALKNCFASYNNTASNGGHGFDGNGFNSFRDCTARDNNGSGFNVAGNTLIKNGSSAWNNREGFRVGVRSNVMDSLSVWNGRTGFVIGSNSKADGLHASANGKAGGAAGASGNNTAYGLEAGENCMITNGAFVDNEGYGMFLGSSVDQGLISDVQVAGNGLGGIALYNNTISIRNSVINTAGASNTEPFYNPSTQAAVTGGDIAPVVASDSSPTVPGTGDFHPAYNSN